MRILMKLLPTWLLWFGKMLPMKEPIPPKKRWILYLISAGRGLSRFSRAPPHGCKIEFTQYWKWKSCAEYPDFEIQLDHEKYAHELELPPLPACPSTLSPCILDWCLFQQNYSSFSYFLRLNERLAGQICSFCFLVALQTCLRVLFFLIFLAGYIILFPRCILIFRYSNYETQKI